MKKLVIFDLKDTLINDKFKSARDYEAIFAYLTTKSVDTVLYTMNEPWTYKAFSQLNERLEVFNKVLLVSKKRAEDIQALCQGYNSEEAIVIGDGEEVEIADMLGISTIKLTELATIDLIFASIEGGCNESCL